jgi:hypothetical protein
MQTSENSIFIVKLAQNGYHAVVLGTDKHKYGYEIKHQGKHFHHTNTEKVSF